MQSPQRRGRRGCDAERYQLTRIAYAIFGGVGHMHHALHVDDRDQSQARAWTYPTRKAG
jgi:hypothetical protein